MKFRLSTWVVLALLVFPWVPSGSAIASADPVNPCELVFESDDGGSRSVEPPTTFPQIVAARGKTQVTLRGIRYARPGAPVFILQHGLTATAETMTYLGKELYERGFEVWMFNFRGHGNGEMRSRVKGAKKGDYGFRRMLLEDMPLIVERVRAVTGGRPISYFGHSMGGMLGKLYLSGVTEIDGKLAVSEDLAMQRSSWIENLITAGSPPHLEDLNQVMKEISRWTEFISTHVNGRLPTLGSLISGELLLTPDLARKVRRAIAGWISGPVSEVMPRFLVNLDNLTDEEIQFLLAEGMSPLNADIGYSFNRWNLEGFTSSDGFDYSKVRPIRSRYLGIYADQDGLGVPGAILEDLRQRAELREQGIEKGERLVHGEVFAAQALQSSHVDLAIGHRSARMLGGFVAAFVSDPHGFVSPVSGPQDLEGPAADSRF